MNITQLLNNNCFVGQNSPRYIILHGTAGGTDAMAIAQFFKGTEGTDNPVSAHYVIGQDGQIVQCNNEKDGAWGNGVVTSGHAFWWSENDNPNNITISIEHCKPSNDNSDALTPAQQASSFALIQDICSRWNVPERAADGNGGVTGHFSIDPINRSRCPGNYPWDTLWAYLQGGDLPMTINLGTPGVSQFFTQGSGNVWDCTNGYLVGNAILDFYRSFGGKDLCGLTYIGLPLSNEIGLGQGRVRQLFERAILVYDPSHTFDRPVGIQSSELVYIAHRDAKF